MRRTGRQTILRKTALFTYEPKVEGRPCAHFVVEQPNQRATVNGNTHALLYFLELAAFQNSCGEAHIGLGNARIKITVVCKAQWNMSQRLTPHYIQQHTLIIIYSGFLMTVNKNKTIRLGDTFLMFYALKANSLMCLDYIH